MKTLEKIAADRGWPAFRVRQIRRAREIELRENWSEISTIPAAERDFLEKNLLFDTLTEVRRTEAPGGSAVKFLLRAADGAEIETVALFHRGREKNWATVCVSSQVGCPVGCRFCATGKMGFSRNLSAEEILDQILIGRRAARAAGIPGAVRVVFMGMGEPLLNFPAVRDAVKILTDPARIGLSPRRITISTAGILPGLRALFAENLGTKLALSLHAADPAVRAKIMPIEKTFPLRAVLTEVKKFADRGDEIIFEVILIAGQNDRPADAEALIAAVGGIPGTVNLIPANPIPGGDFARSPRAAVEFFAKKLRAAGLRVAIRHTKGDEIAAACGQLRAEKSAAGEG